MANESRRSLIQLQRNAEIVTKFGTIDFTSLHRSWSWILFCQLNGELSNFIKRADDVRNSARVNATHPIDWFKSRVMNVLHPKRVDLHNLWSTSCTAPWHWVECDAIITGLGRRPIFIYQRRRRKSRKDWNYFDKHTTATVKEDWPPPPFYC